MGKTDGVIQRREQQWTQEKQSKNTTLETKKMSNTDPTREKDRQQHGPHQREGQTTRTPPGKRTDSNTDPTREKDRQHGPHQGEGQTTQWPKEKGQTTIYKTLHRKIKIEQHEHH